MQTPIGRESSPVEIRRLYDWKNNTEEFEFELRGETCKAAIHDTWNDGHELSVRLTIEDDDLVATGFYYAEKDLLQVIDLNSKRHLAQKFL